MSPAEVGQHGRKLAEVPAFGDAYTTNFEFVKAQVEAISPRTGCRFSDEVQIELPYNVADGQSACDSACDLIDFGSIPNAGLVEMDAETCKEGCACAEDCFSDSSDSSDGDEENLCIARCQSTWNGYIINPDGLLDEADTLAVCQFGEIPEIPGLEVAAACDTVEGSFDGVECNPCVEIFRESEDEDGSLVCGADFAIDNRRKLYPEETCPNEPNNLCLCIDEGQKCDILGPFCDDEAPFKGPGLASCGGGSGESNSVVQYKLWPFFSIDNQQLKSLSSFLLLKLRRGSSL